MDVVPEECSGVCQAHHCEAPLVIHVVRFQLLNETAVNILASICIAMKNKLSYLFLPLCSRVLQEYEYTCKRRQEGGRGTAGTRRTGVNSGLRHLH